MRQVTTWIVVGVLAVGLVGCGPDPEADGTPAADPQPAAEPVGPIPDEVERKALAMLIDFVEQGGDVSETLEESTLLSEPAMDVTRLHVAAERGWLSVARYLVEHGANVQAVAPSKSHYNQLTPLDVARHGGHPHVAAYLEQPGATEPAAVRQIAREFVEAVRSGDLKAALALSTEKAAHAFLPEETEGEHQPAISEYDVREVQVTGERAVADVWLRNEVLPDGEDEFTLVLTLLRAEGDWRVDDIELEPHWEPADLGPEVVR